jgi:hypothetical protein
MKALMIFAVACLVAALGCFIAALIIAGSDRPLAGIGLVVSGLAVIGFTLLRRTQ